MSNRSTHSQLTPCEHRLTGRLHFLTALSAWVSNNVEGSSKRSVSIAMVISLYVSFLAGWCPLEVIPDPAYSGNLNGAVSSNVVG